MATIGKIRKRSGLLLIVIGGAMVAFILGDFLGSKGGNTKVEVGTIAGEPVDIQEFEFRVDEQIQGLKSAGQNVDEAATTQIRNQVWNDLVRDRVIVPQLNDLGLAVTPEEFDDVRFGNNIMPDFANDQNFKNPETGQFDPQRVRQYFVYIQNTYPILWQNQKDRILQTRLNQKYNNLIKKGVYVNSIQAEEQYLAQNKKVDVEFAFKRYTAIADSLVNVTEADVKDYFNSNKGKDIYKQKDSRSASYISFAVAPSDEDINEIRRELTTLAAEFKNATNDTTFVTENGNSQFYFPEEYTAGSLDKETDSLITNAQIGDVIGPFTTGDVMKIVKVVFNGPEKEVNARHILLQAQNGETPEQLKAQGDSLLKVIEANDNFAEIARTVSMDRGSAAKGGELDWFGKGRMVKPFEEGAYSTPKGGLTVVESQFGVHIIEVLDTRNTDKLKLASIDRKLEASNETVNNIYDRASEISINNNTADKLEAAAKEQGLPLLQARNVEPGARFVSGLTNPDAFVRWLYKAEQGEVSAPIEMDGMIAVAVLNNITAEGEPKFEDVKDRMEQEVMKAKKAEFFMTKMQGDNIAAIANNIGETVKNANDLTFGTAVIPGGGREPEVIAKTMTLPANAAPVVLKGELGVYAVVVKAVKEAPESVNYEAQRASLSSTVKGRVDFGAYNALVEQAEVKDERHKFF